MDLDFLIDHMKRKLPMSDKVGNAIVAELKKSLELQERYNALVEALTPSAETMAAFMSEFSIHFEYIDRDGEEIFYEEMIMEIMKVIKQRAEATCQNTQKE